MIHCCAAKLESRGVALQSGLRDAGLGDAAGEVTTFVPSVGRLISIEATVHSASIAGAECSVNPVQNGAEMVSHQSMWNRQRVCLSGVDSR